MTSAQSLTLHFCCICFLDLFKLIKLLWFFFSCTSYPPVRETIQDNVTSNHSQGNKPNQLCLYRYYLLDKVVGHLCQLENKLPGSKF